MMPRRSRAIAALLLLCASQAIARKSSRRKQETDLGFEKKGRPSRKLLHTFDEAWDTATSEQPEMEIDCIRRHDKSNGKGIGKHKSKKSKSSTYFCSENGGAATEESAPVSLTTLTPSPAPLAFPSSESVGIPSAESIPVSASIAPSVLEMVSFTSTPTLTVTSFPSAENSAIPSVLSSLAPSVRVPVAIPSAENVPSPPQDSAPVLVSTSPTSLSPVRSPAPAIEPSPPITNENGDSTSDNLLVRICNSFLAGAAPTFGPQVQFEAKLVLLLDGTSSIQSVLVDIHDILTNQVAPTLLGCSGTSPGGSGRRVQEVVSGLQNVVFAIPSEDPAGVANIGGSAYYTGAYPEGLFDALRSAILSSDILGIAGLAGFGHNFQFRDANEDSTVDSPTDAPADDDVIGENENHGNTKESEQRAGAFVGVVAAGMVAALSLLFAARANRRRRIVGRQLKHQKLEEILTDDESNQYSMSDHDTAPDEGEDMWFANVVDDQDSGIISWGSQTPSMASHLYKASYFPSGGVQFEEGLLYHDCNSPDCNLCWIDTQTRYSLPAVPSMSSSRPRKEMLVHDTVIL